MDKTAISPKPPKRIKFASELSEGVFKRTKRTTAVLGLKMGRFMDAALNAYLPPFEEKVRNGDYPK